MYGVKNKSFFHFSLSSALLLWFQLNIPIEQFEVERVCFLGRTQVSILHASFYFAF